VRRKKKESLIIGGKLIRKEAHVGHYRGDLPLIGGGDLPEERKRAGENREIRILLLGLQTYGGGGPLVVQNEQEFLNGGKKKKKTMSGGGKRRLS